MKNKNISIQGPTMYRLFLFALCLSSLPAASFAEETGRTQPTWWFGAAAGANLNFYSGTAQVLNPGLTTPVPFHTGFGTGLFLAPHLEYRHDSIWGGMLQAGYDNRSGTFDNVICPCGEIATLETEVSYFSIEPSLRVAPFAGRFYMYAGPRLAFNWSPSMTKNSPDDANTFSYTQEGRPSVEAELADMRSVVFSGQLGLGYDIPLSSPYNKTQVDLSPYISYQPYFGQAIRSNENWAVSTLRIGATLKFGNGTPASMGEASETGCDVGFSVRAPKAIIVKRRVRETFPLRNYVFFEDGSTEVPARYVKLDKAQAASFKEEQLQEVQPKSGTGRSLRQMTVYYNIVNTLGDRMKRSPNSTVVLSGSSDNDQEQGRARAQTIKRYLVEVFGIDSARIATEGRAKPRIPSEGSSNTDVLLLQAGNNRVDIESNSPEMMVQVGGDARVLKPVQIVVEVEDPLDSHVLFNVTGADDALASWTLEIKDEDGKIQTYGPFTGERTSISGNAILGERTEGKYKVALIGQKNDGKAMRREASLYLKRRVEPANEALRFSILYDYGQSRSKGVYEKFLRESVVPLVSDSSEISIHGYTDVIGDEAYNQTLSDERVQDARRILEEAIPDSKSRGITFETFGFGENPKFAPFDNNFPEERFYNRSVFIDIVPK